MEDILTTILQDTYSLTQFKHRIRILKSFLLKKFFSNNLDEPLSIQDSEWIESLPEAFLNKFSKDNVYQIFADLEKGSASLPVLTINLAFEPDDATQAQIGTYARKTFGLPTLLLDIKLDPNLIAGASLVWKGVLRDYSLRSKIEAKKEEITQGFKKFLR